MTKSAREERLEKALLRIEELLEDATGFDGRDCDKINRAWSLAYDSIKDVLHPKLAEEVNDGASN